MDYAKNCENGFTDEEMNSYFQTHRSTYRARRSELVEMGLILTVMKKKMENGRMATVWQAQRSKRGLSSRHRDRQQA